MGSGNSLYIYHFILKNMQIKILKFDEVQTDRILLFFSLQRQSWIWIVLSSKVALLRCVCVCMNLQIQNSHISTREERDAAMEANWQRELGI